MIPKEAKILKEKVNYLDLAELMIKGLREQQKDIEQLIQVAKRQESVNAAIVKRISELEQQVQNSVKKQGVKEQKSESTKKILSDEEIERMLRVQEKNTDDLLGVLFSLGLI